MHVLHASYVKYKNYTHFNPTSLKGRRGIVFTHGVRMGEARADGGKKFVRAKSQKP